MYYNVNIYHGLCLNMYYLKLSLHCLIRTSGKDLKAVYLQFRTA